METAGTEQEEPTLEEVVTAFRRFVVRWEVFRGQLASLLDVNVNDVLALMILTLGGPMPVSRLRSELSFTSGATTLLVDRLIRYGLVERVPHPSDGRSVVIRLAPHHEGTLKEARRWLAAPFRGLTPARRGTVMLVLETLTAALGAASTRLQVELAQDTERPAHRWRLRASRRAREDRLDTREDADG